MLVSNIMLGQGSYTPWQMAAWGMVGLAGAALGRLTNRRLGRLPLACACGLAGLAATEVMNVYTWTIGATHTAAAFLLIAGGTAISFNLVDAGASFFFGLAFAPELARVLVRVRDRMDVHWESVDAGTPLVLRLRPRRDAPPARRGRARRRRHALRIRLRRSGRLAARRRPRGPRALVPASAAS